MDPLPVYVTHYRPLTDRRKILEETLQSTGLFPVAHWMDSIDRDTLTEEQLRHYRYDPKRWSQSCILWGSYSSPPRALSRAEIAIALTHIEIYRRIAEGTDPYALILEDDCIFRPDFAERFPAILRALRDCGGDSCFLSRAFGWNPLNYRQGLLGMYQKPVPEGAVIAPMFITHTVDSYILSKEGAQKILKELDKAPFTLPIDWELNGIFMRVEMKNYWAVEGLVEQGSISLAQGQYASSVRRPGE